MPLDNKIEVVEFPHICDSSEACDEHRAARWVARMREQGYPDAGLMECYKALCAHTRFMGAAQQSVTGYHKIIAAVMQRRGGTLSLSSQELEEATGTLTVAVDEAGNHVFNLQPPTTETQDALIQHAVAEEVAKDERPKKLPS